MRRWSPSPGSTNSPSSSRAPQRRPDGLVVHPEFLRQRIHPLQRAAQTPPQQLASLDVPPPAWLGRAPTALLTMTWTSTPGEKYIVKYSSDLDWDGPDDGDLEDGIDADPDETTTTKTFDLSDITPADDTRIYVRVEKEPING